MKKLILIAWALLTLSACNRNTVVVPCDNGAVRLRVISPEIVRVSVSPDGTNPPMEPYSNTISRQASRNALMRPLLYSL